MKYSKTWINNSYRILLLFFILCVSFVGISQPTRNKAIDLTYDHDYYLQIGSSTQNLVAGKAFTYEAWFKLQSNNDNDFTFFDFKSNGRRLSFVLKKDSYFRIEADGGSLEETNWDADELTVSNDFIDKWRHVAFVYNGSSTVSIYVDGTRVYYYSLSRNGTTISSLFPNAGSDYRWRIGGESENGVKGVGHLAEVRLWNTNISHSNMQKYYDEAVNKSHPNYNNLIRYYPGNSDYLTNGANPKFPDHTGNYDAIASNTNATRIRAQDTYPPVKPPRFDNNFNLNFTANDCQTNDINVDWYDLDSDNSYEPEGCDVWYELVRDDNTSKVLLSSATSAYTDTDVSPGDKYRYRVRTVWKINGTSYYSDDNEWSDYGTIKEQFTAPSNLTVTTDNCDKSIDLSWTASNGEPPKWTVERANNTGFSSGKTTLTSSLTGSKNDYTATNQSVETTRYFRVKASGTDANNCTVSGSYSSVVLGNTSYPPSVPTNFNLVESIPNENITLSWSNPSGNNADSWILKKSKSDGSDETTINVALGTTSYVDADIEVCESYRYSIASVNECATDGEYSAYDKTGNVSLDLSTKIPTVEASKGYFGDAVRLEWEVEGSLSEIDRFRIYRTRADEVDYKLIKVVDNDLIYDDETALGGVFYNYKIAGEVACNANTIYTNEPIDMGFVIPYGVANGHIEYDGGNAVEGVTVNFEKENGATGNSLLFDGLNDYAAIDNFYYEGTNYSELTVQTWIKTDTSADQVIASFDRSDYWRLEINGTSGNDGTIGWGVTGTSTSSVTGNIRIDDGEWHQVTTVFDNGYMAIYIDGVLDNETTTSMKTFGTGSKRYGFLGVGSEATSFNGSTGPNDYLNGNLDEFRLWEKALSIQEIQENYNRLIASNTEGLAIYVRCDEGIGSYVYDASKTDDDFNKNDVLLVNNLQFSKNIATQDQLGIRAITDKYGDYTVDYIPYKSGGEIFRAVPTFGQHAFEPNSRAVYIGDGAQTQNNLDFTDISSFTVVGKVTYENSQVPVDGVAILINGVQAVGTDNQPVRTDANGDYEIQVPIGYHFLSTEKNGHTFSEGFFPPLNEYGDVDTYEFTEDLIVNFTDDTKIKVAGRVVGGTVEGNKIIGFGKSTNNIGISEIQFKLQKEGYDLDLNDGNIYDVLSITTDARTGEYEIEMIPEKWVVQKAGNDDYFIEPTDIPVLDLSNSLTPIVLTDSVTNEISNVIEIDTFTYHHELNYIVRENPSVYTYDVNGNVFNGDSMIVYLSQVTGNSDTLLLSNNANFSFPMFNQGKVYGMNIYVQEKYENPAHPDGTIEDFVPVSNAEINISDNFSLVVENNTGKTDATGKFYYEFRAGVPSLSEDGADSYTKTLQVNVTVGQLGVSWPESDVFKGYVLGALPQEGTDFVSYGPETVEMVLRDPPGTNSYAFIEKGSSFSKSETWTMDVNTNTGLNQTWHNGMYFGAGGGLAGPIIETFYTLDSEIGMELERGFDYDGQYTEKWTFNERIETSSDPEDVGSDADVYIGKAYNAFVTKTKSLALLEKSYCDQYGLTYLNTGGNIVLGIIDGYAVDEGNTATFFAYSQRHIVEELLPDLFILRDELFKSDKYESHLPWGHQFYGVSNNNDTYAYRQFKLDTIAANGVVDTTALSYTFTPVNNESVDSVAFINEQIRQWMNAIATNEAEKASAQTTKNVSVDGSGGIVSEQISETYESAYNWQSSRKINFDWNAKFGVTAQGKGYTLKNTFNIGVNIGRGEDAKKSHDVTFGYVIDERDEGDYYSIDVKHNKGISILDRSKFSDFIPKKDEFIEDQLIRGGIGVGFTGIKTIASKLAYKYTSKSHSFLATAAFTVDAAVFMYEMGDVTYNALETFDKQDELGKNFDISGFRISSPIFSVRGGQSKCPYEGDEETSFYVDDQYKALKLNTATLLRENPKIDVEPAVRANVPEDQQAVFTLKLQNESESNSDMWYEISIDEASNPDGAIVLIDGLTAERSYLVPAWKTLSKTLTIQKGATGVLDYDSIAVILHSSCQFDPTTSQDDIADTVYLSAHFLPACSDVVLNGFAENWVVNYDDNNQVTVKLEGYNVNHATLEKIDFQYKSLSGNPIAVKGYFTDTLVADYKTYGDQAALLNNQSDVSFVWDISDLTDRVYQVRARATCSDGSVTETDYLTGIIDRVNPVVFGTPEPADGILNPEDDIKIRFNEQLEAGLVKDHNISLRSVLNGADVSHKTSVKLNGVNEYARIPGVSLNNKSFTVEYWLKRDASTTGTVFSKGAGTEQLEVSFNNDETISIQLGSQNYTVDPQSAYTSVTPVDAWHHWGLAYDNEANQLRFFMDDQLLLIQNDVLFSARNAEFLYFGRNQNGTNSFATQLHEVRIWDKALTVSQSVSTMNATLAGSEIGLYGYWAMDEGNGVLALDKSAGRHMTIDGTWDLYPGSDAFAFNGTDQFLTLDGSNVTITEETDFTVEFWFQANQPTNTQTLFSSGRGDLTDTISNPVYALAINALSTGEIQVVSNGNQFTAVSKNFFDNQWHHFALVVNRQGYTQSFVDGELQKSNSNAGLAGLAGAQLWLGARGFKENPISALTDQYFKGNIDEFRIWNAARNTDLIELYNGTKLNGDEAGLLVYLPFEEYNEVQGTIIRSTTLSDEATPQFLTQANSSVATGGENFVTGAPIQDVRPIQDIPFDFVVNGDEIVITPLIDAYRIEGQIIEINVSNVFDVNGNRQLSTTSWTAYAQQNELVWQESIINIEHQPGNANTFKATIVNLGGVSYNYTLDNMPAWLSTNDVTGSVGPNKTKEITFTVNAALNIGYYEQSINLSTNLDFDEKLTISVSVTEPAPDWSVDVSKFQNSMNIFGRLLIEDVYSTDVNDKVGAFINGEARGEAKIKYIESLDVHMVFLTIYGDTAIGNNIELRVWDASEAKIHGEVTPKLTFTPNEIVGTSTAPIDIIATNIISSTIHLNNGWTWISFNLETTKLETVDSIFTNIGTTGDLVKGQNYFDSYDPSTGWLGSLTLQNNGFKVEDMYKTFVKNGGNVIYNGSPVDPFTKSIAVDSGWTYVGYTPQVSMSIEEALAGFNAQTGDLVKSQTAFSMYDEFFGWVGSLTTMNAHQGYMFKSVKNGTFTYPEFSSLSSVRTSLEELDLPEKYTYQVGKYADNMSIVAIVANEEVTENEVLVAFVNGEVRGITTAEYLNNDLIYFLTIEGTNDENIEFELYNHVTNTSRNVTNQLSYTINEVRGNLRIPYVLETEETNAVIVWPNPFDKEFQVATGVEHGTIQIINVLGTVMHSQYFEESVVKLSLDIPAGQYWIRIISESNTSVKSLIKK